MRKHANGLVFLAAFLIMACMFVWRLLPGWIYRPVETHESEISHYVILSDNSARLNINLATEEELKTIPGIGDVLAARIVEYRSENGQFENTEALAKVQGIGDSLSDKIREYICAE